VDYNLVVHRAVCQPNIAHRRRYSLVVFQGIESRVLKDHLQTSAWDHCGIHTLTYAANELQITCQSHPWRVLTFIAHAPSKLWRL
jgi:hypothetical protein